MIRDILLSDVRPVEKAVLVFEWILREKMPQELFALNLSRFAESATDFFSNEATLDLRQAALREVKEIFGTSSDSESFLILAALSYYSYIDDEFVYERAARGRLLAKIPELGISLSRFHDIIKKWNRIAGSSDDLFNRIFREAHVEAR
jgi:hypothetical protein